MYAQWYVLRSKPKKEGVLQYQVELRGINVFNPNTNASPVNPRANKTKPLFPGYIFIHADLDLISPSIFQWMPYAAGLVSFGGQPASISESLIQDIRKHVDLNATRKDLFDLLKPGDAITIKSGPLEGYEAVFDMQLSSTERIRILLTLANNKQMLVELPARYVQMREQSDYK